MNLVQQLSSLLDEPVGNQALDNFLQELDKDRNLRDLCSRYVLIGAVMRGESINPAATHISEQVRNRLALLPATTIQCNECSKRWFNYSSAWNLAISMAMLIAMAIGLRILLPDLNPKSSPQVGSYNRHFWPGVIALNTNRPLSRYEVAEMIAYPKVNSVAIMPWQEQSNDTLIIRTNAIQDYNLNHHIVIPAQYLESSYKQ